MKSNSLKQIILRNLFLNISALLMVFSFNINNTFSQCDTIICNGKLTGLPANYGPFQTRKHFADGLVPCWLNLGGTPHLNSNAYSSPSAAMIYSYYISSNLSSLDNESFLQPVNLQQGHRYILKYKAVRDSSGMNNNGFIRVTFWGAPKYFNTLCDAGRSSGLTFTWLPYGGCFTAPRKIGGISFESIPLNTNNLPAAFWCRIDDVEIFEIIAQAGSDTILCYPDCVTLGKICNGTPLNINRQFQWKILGDPNVLSTLSNYTACPSVTTTYVLKVSLDGCEAYDTVTVVVVNKPNINLGNDTIICGPISKILDAGFDSNFDYLWSTGSTNHSININSGGTYWVSVSSSTRCSDSDTIKIIQRPDFTICPKDTIVCYSTDSVDITVYTQKFDSLRWSTRETTQRIRVIASGDYIVTVYDSGCMKTDTAHIRQIRPPFLYIGPDTIKVCDRSSITLCDTNS